MSNNGISRVFIFNSCFRQNYAPSLLPFQVPKQIEYNAHTRLQYFGRFQSIQAPGTDKREALEHRFRFVCTRTACGFRIALPYRMLQYCLKVLQALHHCLVRDFRNGNLKFIYATFFFFSDQSLYSFFKINTESFFF